jgi:hypothetical protein
MLEISSYSEPLPAGTMVHGAALGYRLALKDRFWFSSQAEVWLGQGDMYPCKGGQVFSVDVLPPARPPEYRRPVFLSEARRGLFARYETFGKGELLRFLFQCCHVGPQHLVGSPNENLLLLSGQKVGVVHRLPAYGCWQLHVTEDLPYLINPDTRIFALQ